MIRICFCVIINSEYVWARGQYAVAPSSIIDLLYNEPIKFEVTDAFLSIITSKEYRLKHGISRKIGFINTHTMVSSKFLFDKYCSNKYCDLVELHCGCGELYCE